MTTKTPTPVADARREKFTPGPWQTNVTRYPDGSLVGAATVYAPNGDDGGRHVCELCANGQLDANARLIAAAPELLEACKQALFALGECSVGEDKLSDLFPVKVQKLRNAIAKAGRA